MQIQFELEQAGRLHQAWTQYPDVVEAELTRFLAGATQHLQGEVADRTPAAHGVLRRSILGDYQVADGIGVGTVTSSAAHAVPVELGTRPHPVSEAGIVALQDWVETKLGLAGDEALGVAHAIAWKIRRRGSQGVFMFRDAFTANQAELQRRFGLTVERTLGRLSSELP
ncbi:hypothetical protein YWS52_10170 [Chitiniphilus shinanonensis]